MSRLVADNPLISVRGIKTPAAANGLYVRWYGGPDHAVYYHLTGPYYLAIDQSYFYDEEQELEFYATDFPDTYSWTLFDSYGGTPMFVQTQSGDPSILPVNYDEPLDPKWQQQGMNELDDATGTLGTITIEPIVGVISTPDELQAIDYNNTTRAAHYIQTDDIDLDITPYNTGAGFQPIGTETAPFTGTYDGQNFKIQNLFINRPTTDYVGLFGHISSEANVVKKVRLTNPDITGRGRTGTLAGQLLNLTLGVAGPIVEDCSSTGGNVRGINGVGGLIGTHHHASRSFRCFSTTAVTGSNNNVGGYCGTILSSPLLNRLETQIFDCYARGNVVGGGNAAGGFSGNCITDHLSVARCYASGLVSGDAVAKGAFIANDASALPDPDSVQHCYYIADTDDPGNLYATRLSIANAKNKKSYHSSWDFRTLWDITPTENDAYPYLNPRKAMQAGSPGLYRSLYRKR